MTGKEEGLKVKAKALAMAKRTAGRWFLAVENGAEARKLDIRLGFLGAGRWNLLGFWDDPSGRLDAAVREERTVTSGESVGLDIRSCGGYVAMIVNQGD